MQTIAYNLVSYFAKPVLNGGIPTYVYQLIKGVLASKDFNVILIGTKNAKELFSGLGDFTYVEYPQAPTNEIEKLNYFKQFFTTDLDDILISSHCDIYHGTGNYDLPVKPKGQYKKILTLHDIIPITDQQYFDNIHEEQIREQTREDYLYLLNNAVTTADLIITSSNYSATEILAHWPTLKSPEVVYLPVNISKEKSANNSNANKYLLCHCGLYDRKNVMQTVTAFGNFYPDKQTVLKITGDIFHPHSLSQVKQIQELITKNNWQSRIILTGLVTRRELDELISNAFATISLSQAEGFGLYLAEDIVAGIPAIISNLGALPEIAGDAAFIVNPNNIKSIKDAFEKINVSTIRAKLIKNCEQRKQLFSAEFFDWKMQQIYTESLRI